MEGDFEIQTLSVDGIITGTSYITSPELGEHSYLYSGEKNNYLCDYSLLDFTSYYALSSDAVVISNPDTVDSMSMKIYLPDSSQYLIPSISLSYLTDDIDSIFNENTTLYEDFNLADYPDQIDFGTFQMSETDTSNQVQYLQIVLKDSSKISNFLLNSNDTTKCFLLSQFGDTDFIKMYSSESFFKPQLNLYYTVTDSTDSSWVQTISFPVLQDVTLLNPPATSQLPTDSLYIGGSIFESVLQFNLDPFSHLTQQLVFNEDSYIYLNSKMEVEESLFTIFAYSILDTPSLVEHFDPIEEKINVDNFVNIPVEYENGKLKIQVQSYFQYVLSDEIEHFGIILRSSIHNDPFSIISVEKPDSGYSNISLEFVTHD